MEKNENEENNEEIINKITDKIYLGGIDGANDIKKLKKEGITNILSLIGDESPDYERGLFDRKIIDVDDISKEDLFRFFKDSIEFIEDSDKVYIHCMAGMSRSASIVIAYLMWKEHKKFIEAFNFVKEKRKLISPNCGFIMQLKYFESLLSENNYDLRKINFKKLNFNELWKKYG